MLGARSLCSLTSQGQEHHRTTPRREMRSDHAPSTSGEVVFAQEADEWLRLINATGISIQSKGYTDAAIIVCPSTSTWCHWHFIMSCSMDVGTRGEGVRSSCHKSSIDPWFAAAQTHHQNRSPLQFLQPDSSRNHCSPGSAHKQRLCNIIPSSHVCNIPFRQTCADVPALQRQNVCRYEMQIFRARAWLRGI